MPISELFVPQAKGRMRASYVPDSPGHARRLRSRWNSNLVLQEWAAIIIQLLSRGATNFRISGMYLEYYNVAAPDDPAPIPSYDRGPNSGVAYYSSLAGIANSDYLRVPIIAATTGTSNATQYPEGNLLTFFAQTGGVAGVWGKPFGNAYNSVIIGGALVAEVDPSDATQDLVFSRSYYTVENQQPKLATGQVGVEWELEFQ